MNGIIRVFPRRTNATPVDSTAYINCPPPMFFTEEPKEIRISVAFTYDLDRAYELAYQWQHIAPVRIGGPAMDEPGGEFVPGMYIKKGYVITSRGCPNKCLHGDTLISTIDGDIPIKELVGKNTMVLTRTKENEPIFAKAIHIRKTGDNEQIIRVHFDNGDYLDCTPDHLLKTFKNSNQFAELREFDVRADRLKPGDSVVSVHFLKRPDGYTEVNYGRHKSVLLHRLIMQSVLGRKMSRNEYVHHIDHNKANNVIDNLMLTDNKTHCSYHQEISQRMKLKNPTLNMTEEWRDKVKTAGKGSKRTLEQRLRYRESKLGTNNPNYKHGKSNCKSRIDEDRPYINHRVKRIEYLNKKSETYCMEVPGYDWFFANGVFVHNCWFCRVPIREGGAMRELEIKEGNNILDDNLLACSEKHIREVFAMLKRQKYGRPKFTGGLEAARLKDWHVELLRDLKPDEVFFAYDTPDDYEPLVEAGKKLNAAGFKQTSHHTFRAYVLIGYPRDTFEKAEARLMQTIRAGVMPMAMLYRDKQGRVSQEWAKFQREWARPAIVNSKIKAVGL